MIITFYTPTYKRPKALAICQASVQAQIDAHWEHIIIPDEVGLGIGGMYKDIPNHIYAVHGDYVIVLSDDDRLTSPELVGRLRRFIAENNWPPVVIFKSVKSGRELPSIWHAPPQLGHIDLGNFAVRTDVWKANAHEWGDRYEGDFSFIDALWKQGLEFCWFDFIGMEAQRISRGQPE